MKTYLKNISSLVTVNANGKLYKNGTEMQDVAEIKNGAVIFDDKIIFVGTTIEADEFIAKNDCKDLIIKDCSGTTVLPGFADSHTHFVFAGNRSNEFGMRLRGATYQEIAAMGGGIIATMNATRNATLEELVDNGRKLALSAMKHGTTCVEIKSGYGLTLESEIKQLEAVKILKEELPLHISATFLGAHDFPPEYKDNRDKYVDLICNEMIPRVAESGLAEYCDAFIDQGYYTIEQGRKIFETAVEHGLKLKIHADELACVEAAVLAAEMDAVSADHLLCVSDKGIDALKKHGTVATLMPGTAYFIRMPYAPARKIIENDCILSLATDCNPGSCFTENMQVAMSLAVINMRMTAEETICAATLNGAYAMRKSDITGSLEVGKSADMIIANVGSYIDLFYHFGINHVSEVWLKGNKVV